MINTDQKMLITTDEWFFAKDGQSYRAIWGKVKIIEGKDLLGLTPKNSANWYAQIGEDEESIVLIAGCRIHYAQMCPTVPTGTHVLKV